MRVSNKLNAVSLALFTLLFPLFAKAAGALDGSAGLLKNVNDDDGRAGSTAPLPTLIGGIISVVLGSLGIVFVIFIVQAGIMYMTAGGDPGKVDKAKKLITQAVIGLIIVVSAYTISSFVITQISGATAAAP